MPLRVGAFTPAVSVALYFAHSPISRRLVPFVSRRVRCAVGLGVSLALGAYLHVPAIARFSGNMPTRALNFTQQAHLSSVFKCVMLP